MLILRSGEFSYLLYHLFRLEILLRGKVGPLSADPLGITEASRLDICRICRSLGLSMSATTFEEMMAKENTAESMHAAILQGTNTLLLEIKDSKYYAPLPEYLKYYSNPKLFGDEVFDRFSSANDDIFEAGACLAFERSTACVMHLMKVLEVGLAALAQELGADKQNDWGSYIREIGKKLDARAKGAKARSGDEQFFAEAGASFDRMKRAWRNPTMHPDRSYSQQRAEEILLAVKSFMIHLSTKLRE